MFDIDEIAARADTSLEILAKTQTKRFHSKGLVTGWQQFRR